MDENTPRQRVSRRTVVKGAAAAVAAGTAGFTLAGPAQAASAHGARGRHEHIDGHEHAGAGSAAAPGEGLVAHVRDLRTGEMDLYHGERHVQVRDLELAKRLATLVR